MSKIITFIVDEQLLIDRLANDINSGKSTTVVVDHRHSINKVLELVNPRLIKDCTIKIKTTDLVETL